MPTETKTALIPVGERILVKRREAEAVSEGGIHIPEKAREKPKEGTVFAVGDECKRLKEGDRVLFSAFTGTEINFDDETYLIMREDEVLCLAR